MSMISGWNPWQYVPLLLIGYVKLLSSGVTALCQHQGAQSPADVMFTNPVTNIACRRNP